MTALTRESAKIVLAPVRHESHGRVTRVTARAYLGRRDGSDDYAVGCPHTHGHKTLDAAKACGIKLWDKLPSELG